MYYLLLFFNVTVSKTNHRHFINMGKKCTNKQEGYRKKKKKITILFNTTIQTM